MSFDIVASSIDRKMLRKERKIMNNINKLNAIKNEKYEGIAIPSSEPNSFSMANAKMARALFENNEVNKTYGFYVEKNVATTINVVMDNELNNNNVNITKHLDFFDWVILNAISTLYINEIKIFTPEIIANLLNNSKRLPTKNFVNEITERIDTLRKVFCEINWTEQYEARNDLKKNLDNIEEIETTIETTLVDADKVTSTIKYQANGKVAKVAYVMNSAPCLLRYASYIRQVATVPYELLDSSDIGKDCTFNLLVRHYVIRRLAEITHSNGLASRKISLEWTDSKSSKGIEIKRGLLPSLGLKLEDINRKKKKQILDMVKFVLERAVELNLITSFEAYREHNSKNKNIPIIGYEVKLAAK